MIPTLLGITLLTFFIMKLAPGDPVSLKLMFAGEGISPQALATEMAKSSDPLILPEWYQNTVKKISHKIHGNKPKESFTEKSLLWLGKNFFHYGKWLNNLTHLDLGISKKDMRPVSTKIKEALPLTLTLNIITILIVHGISIPLGIWSAVKASKFWDRVLMLKLFILYSLPTFWVATLLVVFLAGGEYFDWFPLMGLHSEGAEKLSWMPYLLDMGWHLVLPILASVYGSFAFLSRFTRSTVLEVIHMDYIRTARAKGLSEGKIIFKHVLRNSLIPLISLSGTLLPALLGGSIMIEQIFGIPGMGMLSFEAVLGRDYNVIMGLSTITAFLTLVSLLLADLAYSWVDPRISYSN